MRAAVAELEEFAQNASVSPTGILLGEPDYQLLEIEIEASTLPRRASAVGSPLPADELTMPSEAGL